MKVGIIFSTFNLLHAWHVKMLKEAKIHCDYLIVGLQLDPLINRPEKMRLHSLLLIVIFSLKDLNILMKYISNSMR